LASWSRIARIANALRKADSQTSAYILIRNKNAFALGNFHRTIGGMTQSSDVPAGRLSIAVVGFGAVATGQATNMILARANGGYSGNVLPETNTPVAFSGWPSATFPAVPDLVLSLTISRIRSKMIASKISPPRNELAK
jgi:hypothetical protein